MIDIKGFLNHLHPACSYCIKCNTLTSDQYTNDGHLIGKKGEFPIKCHGIPKDWETFLKEELMPEDWDTLNEEEKKTVVGIYDVAKWANENLTIQGEAIVPRGATKENMIKYELDPEAAYYQWLMLSCSAYRCALRNGRRTGKSLGENTYIATPFGPKLIKDFKPGDIVYGYDSDTDSIFETPVIQLHDNGIAECNKYYNHNRYFFSGTPEHRWHVTTCNSSDKVGKSIKAGKDFQKYDYITRKFINPSLGPIDEPHAYAIAALLGNGCSRQDKLKIYISSEDGIVPNTVANILGGLAKKEKGGNYTWSLSRIENEKEIIHCNYHKEWCKNRYSHEKICDLNIIKTWNRESCLAFLAGLLDTDGCVQDDGTLLDLSWMMQAKSVIEVVQYILFALFQYRATIRIDNREKYKNGPCYCLNIHNNLFCKRILKALQPYSKLERKRWKDKYENYLENNTNENYCGFKVLGTAIEHVYDLEIDTKDHLYLTADGLVTHNSFAIAIKIIHALLTNSSYGILLVCPYKSQVDLVFKMIENLCQTSSKFQLSIKRYVSTPYPKIELWNGSTATGFTSGSKTGTSGNTIRGMGANWIVMDESDLLNPNDMASIMGVLADNPEIKVWSSSTPTGKRERFYQMCQMPTYRKFHFPSMANPNWNDSMERELRDFFIGAEYTHEILGDFGSNADGVFQKQYIDRALIDYKYTEQIFRPGWVYSIGVDWNASAGVEIVVVGAFTDDKGNIKFRTVDVGDVPQEGMSELKAVTEIVRLHRKWGPFQIYVDYGGGGSLAVEMLHNVGAEAIRTAPNSNDSSLLRNVKAINFSTTVETYDPWTKEKVERPMKVFSVTNAVRQFENDRIEISKFDQILCKQIQGYIVDRVNYSGIPIYSAGSERSGDHRLDAFMLALLAFSLEKTEIGKPRHTANIAYVSQGKGFSDDMSMENRRLITEMEKQLQKAKIAAKQQNLDRTAQLTLQTNSPIANGKLGNSNIVDWDPRKYYDMTTERPQEHRFNRSILSGSNRHVTRRASY